MFFPNCSIDVEKKETAGKRFSQKKLYILKTSLISIKTEHRSKFELVQLINYKEIKAERCKVLNKSTQESNLKKHGVTCKLQSPTMLIIIRVHIQTPIKLVATVCSAVITL